MSRNKHLTKLYIKCPLHLKYMLTLPWEIQSVTLSHQRSNCMYILMNQWIATNTTGSYCLPKIVKRVVSHIIGTCLPIFIKIGSYLTDTEQKISCHSFYWDTLYYPSVWSSGFLRRGSDGMELASRFSPGPCSEYRQFQIGFKDTSLRSAAGRLAH